jgi:hypothetical protein
LILSCEKKQKNRVKVEAKPKLEAIGQARIGMSRAKFDSIFTGLVRPLDKYGYEVALDTLKITSDIIATNVHCDFSDNQRLIYVGMKYNKKLYELLNKTYGIRSKHNTYTAFNTYSDSVTCLYAVENRYQIIAIYKSGFSHHM